MNKIHNNQFKMFLSTQNQLNQNASIWSPMQRIVACKTEADELIGLIQSKAEQSNLKTSVTQQKEELKNTIALKTSSLSGLIQVYASDTGNTDLINNIKISASEVTQTKDANLDAVVRNVCTHAQQNQQALISYSVTEDTINELLTLLNQYNQLIGVPRSLQSSKYAKLQSIDELFDKANDLFKNKLDKLMLIYRESHPEFFSAYHSARVIINN